LSISELLPGLVPLVILALVLRTRYRVNISFCDECWRNNRTANILDPISALGFLFGFIVSIVIGVATESLIPAFVVLALSVGFYIWGNRYAKRIGPKISKIDRTKMVISTPNSGELSFDSK